MFFDKSVVHKNLFVVQLDIPKTKSAASGYSPWQKFISFFALYTGHAAKIKVQEGRVNRSSTYFG